MWEKSASSPSHLIGCGRSRVSPAEGVGAAGASELQAGGFVPLLVGAGGDDGAAAALGTRLVRTRAEQQGVAELPRDALEELTQSLKQAEHHASGFMIELLSLLFISLCSALSLWKIKHRKSE